MISFTVFGIPAPQGSMKAFLRRGSAQPIVTADNSKTKPWRQQIAGEALVAMSEAKAYRVDRKTPVRIEASFYFPRPESVRLPDKTTKPDLDKLIRALLDALTGIAFDDDSQVTEVCACKAFGHPPRLDVRILEHVRKRPCTAVAFALEIQGGV